MPLSADKYQSVAKLNLRLYWWENNHRNPAPEGRSNLAQRFSAGKVAITSQVPEGRPSFVTV